MTLAATLIGHVGSVNGATVSVQLIKDVSSGNVILNGRTYRIGQVGSFVRVPQGYQSLYGLVSDIGAAAVPSKGNPENTNTGRWMTVQLLGEALGDNFERGISQHPGIGDEIHLVTEADLKRIYGDAGSGLIRIGSLSSSENISVFVDIDKLVTRHGALVGSTGSGKSTTVSSLLRSISAGDENKYPSARILVIDIHGEYSKALSDVGSIFKIDADKELKENSLFIPFWALDFEDIYPFLFGSLSESQRTALNDRILALKKVQVAAGKFPGVSIDNLTIDTPTPYSLHQLWYDLSDFELRTFKDKQRTDPDLISAGDAKKLIAPSYNPPTSDNTAPYMNPRALGIRKQLDHLRSRLLDHKYDFLLHPGSCEPELDGTIKDDLDSVLESWLGHNNPITILDLSGVPDEVLVRLIGTILRVVYDALFWSRKGVEGGVNRPVFIVMEEAHRYLSPASDSGGRKIAQRIVKEGRKYGIGAFVVSQRPSEIDDTILSQCGTFFALRLSNQTDRSSVKSTLSDNLIGLVDMLPILRTGEAIVTGEAVRLPMRCRVQPPPLDRRPDSTDPKVSAQWSKVRDDEDYKKMIERWRSKTYK